MRYGWERPQERLNVCARLVGIRPFPTHEPSIRIRKGLPKRKEGKGKRK